MSDTVAMDVDQKVQYQYIPKDYPHLKMTLFRHLGDTDIDEMVSTFGISPGLMSEGSNKRDGAKLKMVNLLEQKGHISTDSIADIITLLQELDFKLSAATIKKLYLEDSNFGRFKVALANQFTNDIMYGLATLLEFQPAEINDLIPDNRGMKLVLRLEQRNIISERDVSELITTLENKNMKHYSDLLKKLKEVTTKKERPPDLT